MQLRDKFIQLKSPNTRRAYKTTLNQLANFLHPKPIEEATSLDIMDFLNSLANKAPNTIRHRYRLLKSYFEFLVAFDCIGKNPVLASKQAIMSRRPRQVRPTKMIEPELILRLLNLPDTRDRAGLRDKVILTLLTGGGLRRGEVVRLNVGDIHISVHGTPYLKLNETKAGQAQDRALPEWAWPIISELVSRRKQDGAQEGDPLLINYKGYGGKRGRLSVETLARTVKRYMKLVGIEASCHSLRASFASRLKELGCEDRDVAFALGHKSVAQIQMYDKRARGVDQSAAKKIIYH